MAPLAACGSVWEDVDETLRRRPPVRLRHQQIDELFSLKTTPVAAAAASAAAPHQPTVDLLDAKRSLALHVFLRQFKCPVDIVVDRVRTCDATFFDAHQLHCLKKLLPDKDEVTSITESFFFSSLKP